MSSTTVGPWLDVALGMESPWQYWVVGGRGGACLLVLNVDAGGSRQSVVVVLVQLGSEWGSVQAKR